MSEFDAFETSAPEEDPAAGFIAIINNTILNCS
jgi:hypothetical protein